MKSLAKGAVAAAEAQQLETTARGRAKAETRTTHGALPHRAPPTRCAADLVCIVCGTLQAATIEAEGQASALKISARADADADVTRAEGSQQAARLLDAEAVAVKLATIAATGEAQGHTQCTTRS